MTTTLSPQNGAKATNYSMADEDEDAEHEDDPMMDEKIFVTGATAPPFDIPRSTTAEEGGGNLEQRDAEAEVEDDDEAVGPVKVAEGDESGSEAHEEKNADSDEDVDNMSDEEISEKASSDAESDAGVEWEEQSNDGEDEDAAVVNANCCIFCGNDEEHDPSEDYEEYLACSVCGDNAHRQCARTENSLGADDEAEKWRCPSCVEHALEPDRAEQRTSRRRSSANKLTRDLLPAQRGAPRPGSHSVFNQLIVNDDPLDGSRLLRKRKTTPEDVDEPQQPFNKRQRKSAEDSSSDSESSTNRATSVKKGGIKVNEITDVSRKTVETAAAASPPRSRPSRQRAPKKVDPPSTRVLRKGQRSLVLAFRVQPSRLAKVLSSEPRRKNRRPPKPPEPPPQVTYPYPTPFSSTYATPFYSFHERENDELKLKPYGGILSEADADTSKTLPQASDREKFNEAKRKAEEAWSRRAMDPTGTSASGGPLSQKVAGPASKIQCINFGGYEIDTWYAAPYPEEYSRNRVLYICEFCLKYMNSEYVAWRHKLKCPAKHPPGDEIYREGSVSVFEVDGRKNPVYCQNLCLLAKLFLGSKTLYYDVEPFLFYVMTEYDDLGCRFVGYFSKEKRPSSSNNVSCILTLPIHQRKGYGNLLIDFSYLLTRVERKTGSPEKPLSDMGLVSYRNYWRLVLCYQLRDQKTALSIADISNRTGMTADDIVSALEGLRALVRDPVTGTYALRLDYNYFQEYIEKWEAKGHVRLNPEALTWTPYIMGRSNLANLEHAPPLATIAPRDDEGETDVGPSQLEEGVQMEISENNRLHESSDVIINGFDKNNVDTDHTGPFNPVTPSTDTDRAMPTEKRSGSLHRPLPGPPPKTPLAKPPLGRSPSRLNNTAPSSPAIPPIPPTRFEIFPPLPGTTVRRRAGRPPASARRRTATPASVSRRRDAKSGSVGIEGDDNHPPRTGLGAGKGKAIGKRNTRVSCRNESIDQDESGGGNRGQQMEMTEEITATATSSASASASAVPAPATTAALEPMNDGQLVDEGIELLQPPPPPPLLPPPPPGLPSQHGYPDGSQEDQMEQVVVARSKTGMVMGVGVST